MKKLLQKINTKGARSVVFGLVLTFAMVAGTSIVSAQFAPAAEPFLGSSTGLMSRIGSLTIGASSSASWLSGGLGSRPECIHTSVNPLFASETCFDVTGGGTFNNLVIDQSTKVVETATVSDVGDYGGGFGELGVVPAFLIEDVTGVSNDSMIVQGLGRLNGGQNFNPIDYTTERDVCAESDGTLRIC